MRPDFLRDRKSAAAVSLAPLVGTNDLLRNYAISTIQSPNLILALLALCAVPFLVGAIMARRPSGER
jgi:hypothetical protein